MFVTFLVSKFFPKSNVFNGEVCPTPANIPLMFVTLIVLKFPLKFNVSSFAKPTL